MTVAIVAGVRIHQPNADALLGEILLKLAEAGNALAGDRTAVGNEEQDDDFGFIAPELIIASAGVEHREVRNLFGGRGKKVGRKNDGAKSEQEEFESANHKFC